MSIHRQWVCDGPTCGHVNDDGDRISANAGPYPGEHPPPGFVTIYEGTGTQTPPLFVGVYCGWDCVLAKAGTFPPAIIIPFDDQSGGTT